MATRDKTWAECALEEKVERLRQVTRSLEHETAAIGEVASQAHDLAHDHGHDHLGRVVRAAKDFTNRLIGGLREGSRRRNSRLD